MLSNTDVTFLLTSGGHNAGIISEPGHLRRHHRIATKREGEPYMAHDEWLATTKERDGSWWPTWPARHSGDQVKPPDMGKATAGFAPPCDAPGGYVLEE